MRHLDALDASLPVPAPSQAAGGAGSERNLRELFRMARETTSILDLRHLLVALLDKFMEITEADRGFIMLDWKNRKIDINRNFTPAELDTDRLAVSHTVLHDVARSGRSIFVPDTMVQQAYGSRESIAALKLRSFCCVPMVHDGQVQGLCYTDSRRPVRRLGSHEQDSLEAFADQAAVAIVNATRHEELKRAASQLQEENRDLREQIRGRFSYDRILGKSDAMVRVFETLRRIEHSSASVLVHGETGTGKELVAQAIHHNGPQREAKLVTINCGAIPEPLVESELFGHRKGAFTDAHQDRPGRVLSADGGTLFLDEVGELPLGAQVKLLRLLQEGEVTPVGSDEARRVRVRIIAATNRDLQQEIRAGRFREDLYYRLHVIPIHLPALRERGADVLLLAERFITQVAAAQAKAVPGADADVRRWMLQYAWPGNVRQLQNALERAVTLARDGALLSIDLFPEAGDSAPAAAAAPGTLREILDHVEAAEVERALQQANHVVSQAAANLGVSRQHLHTLIRKHALRRP